MIGVMLWSSSYSFLLIHCKIMQHTIFATHKIHLLFKSTSKIPITLLIRKVFEICKSRSRDMMVAGGSHDDCGSFRDCNPIEDLRRQACRSISESSQSGNNHDAKGHRFHQ